MNIDNRDIPFLVKIFIVLLFFTIYLNVQTIKFESKGLEDIGQYLSVEIKEFEELYGDMTMKKINEEPKGYYFLFEEYNNYYILNKHSFEVTPIKLVSELEIDENYIFYEEKWKEEIKSVIILNIVSVLYVFYLLFALITLKKHAIWLIYLYIIFGWVLWYLQGEPLGIISKIFWSIYFIFSKNFRNTYLNKKSSLTTKN